MQTLVPPKRNTYFLTTQFFEGHTIKTQQFIVVSALLCASMANAANAEGVDGTTVAVESTKPVVPIAPVQPVVEVSKQNNVLTFNLGVISDYRFGGISVSNFRPAVQGGVDYTNNPTGLYAGTFLSSIKWINDAGGNDNLEWDLYAGKKGEINSDFSYDVGAQRYLYPSNDLPISANTTYIYAQLSYKLVNLRYSRTVTTLFGLPNSKNSSYLDLNSTIPLPKDVTLGLHVGHQEANGNSMATYSDWKIGVAKDVVGLTWTLAVVGTDADHEEFRTPDGRFTGRTGVVLSAVKTW